MHYLDLDEWNLPRKPKWMRSKTYICYEQGFDRSEEILELPLCPLGFRYGLRISG